MRVRQYPWGVAEGIVLRVLQSPFLCTVLFQKNEISTPKIKKKTFSAFIVSISLLKDCSEHHSMDPSLSLARLSVLRRIFGFVKSYYALNVKFSKGEISLRAERE